MRRFATALAVALVTAGLATAPAQAAPPPIEGGTDAITNPGVVSIWTANPARNRCGGTLVHREWVLTAAHCWYALNDPTAGAVEVRIGSLDNTQGYTPRGVEAYHWHPDFDPNTLRSDIMLLKLDAAVPASVQKPADWTRGPVPVGTVGEVAGWGWLCADPATCIHFGPLQRMSARVIVDSECAVAAFYPAQQVCFESASGSNTMACNGDSGVGLYTKGIEPGYQYVRAVVTHDGDTWSGPAQCGTAPDGGNGLGVATDIAPFRDWMTDVMTP